MMLDISLQNLAKILGAGYQGNSEVKASGVAIDSRRVQKGDLFFALPGEKVDGHEFIDEALAKGAVGAVISDVNLVKAPEDKNLIICRNPLKLLQDLAKLVRQNTNIPVVAITGSTGKTTTKDLIFSILSQTYNCLKTEGNYNNELGLPLTLCKLNREHEAAVLEMGMRGLGQISFLCEIAQPTLGVITNIGQVHAELLGSQEKIAQAKAELLEYLPPQGTVVLNIDAQSLLKPWLKNFQGQVLWFGLREEADIRAKNIQYLGEEGSKFTVIINEEEEEITVNIPGEHNILNALAGIGIARTLGVGWEHIKRGLRQAQLTGMRLEILENDIGVKILNDTYNANPTSMAASLKTLAHFSGTRKIAVLGDMYELGIYEEEGHKLMGQIACREKVDLLVAVGNLGKLIGQGAIEAGLDPQKVVFAANNEDTARILKGYLNKGDVVLVKGSRGMQMEEIVNELMR